MLETLALSPHYWWIVALVATAAGVVGSMGGPGGLIITPFLIVTGLPPAMAIGTVRLSSLGMWSIALLKFHRAEQIHWPRVPAMAVVSIVGGTIGSLMVVNVNEELIYPIVGVILLLIGPLSLWRPDIGIRERSVSRTSLGIGFGLYFLVSVFAGFFAGGSGMLMLATVCTFWGWTALRAHATDVAPWLLQTVATCVVFIWYDQIDYWLAVVLFVGLGVGGYIGSHLAIKGGSQAVRLVAVGFAILIGLRLLWGAV